ncbi:MAG: tetratricopeptide repeat protein [Pseudobacter sp.]|uniref:tetratricopeptide repeat protein n=1 Tax=Pseudobacter sp. TaxID=2045420 RepID=UPI003F8183A0
MEFIAGDIFYLQEQGSYLVFKLLVNEEESDCYHLLSYEPLTDAPTEFGLEFLTVYSYHSTIYSKAFADAIYFGNYPVVAEELTGYHEYLRQTQEPAYCVNIAKEYYQTALRLTGMNLDFQAIEEYSKAIDLIPQFFEAFDNRAFCKMDLGFYEEAIEDFRQSLLINPDSFLAEFSIGECYFKLGDYFKAKEQFEIAARIEPAHEGLKFYLAKVNAHLSNGLH